MDFYLVYSVLCLPLSPFSVLTVQRVELLNVMFLCNLIFHRPHTLEQLSQVFTRHPQPYALQA